MASVGDGLRSQFANRRNSRRGWRATAISASGVNEWSGATGGGAPRSAAIRGRSRVSKVSGGDVPDDVESDGGGDECPHEAPGRERLGRLDGQAEAAPDEALYDGQMSGRATVYPGAVLGGAGRGEANVDAEQGAAGPPRTVAQARDEGTRLDLPIERRDPLEIGSRLERPPERHAIERRPAREDEIPDGPLEVVPRPHEPVSDETLDSPGKGEAASRKRAVAVLEDDEQPFSLVHRPRRSRRPRPR